MGGKAFGGARDREDERRRGLRQGGIRHGGNKALGVTRYRGDKGLGLQGVEAWQMRLHAQLIVAGPSVLKDGRPTVPATPPHLAARGSSRALMHAAAYPCSFTLSSNSLDWSRVVVALDPLSLWHSLIP